MLLCIGNRPYCLTKRAAAGPLTASAFLIKVIRRIGVAKRGDLGMRFSSFASRAAPWELGASTKYHFTKTSIVQPECAIPVGADLVAREPLPYMHRTRRKGRALRRV